MQDLFQLGNIVQEAGTTSESGRSARRARGSKAGGSSSEAPNYEALLAIAATLARNTPDETFRSPTTSELSIRNIDSLVGPAAQGDAGAADIRDLLGAFNQPSLQIAGEGVIANEAGESGIPLAFDYRPVSRSVTVSIEQAGAHQGFERTMSSRDVSAKSSQVGLMNPADSKQSSNDEGHPLDSSRQMEAELERLLRWRFEPAHGEPVRTTFDDGGLVAPDLHVVVRNDNPLRLATRNIAPPDLRIVENSAEMAEIQAGRDLVDRLAGTWGSSFVSASEEGLPGDHSIDPMLDTLDHPALAKQSRTAFGADGEPGLRLVSRQNGAVASLLDDDEMVEAAIEGDDGFGRALLDKFTDVEDARSIVGAIAGLGAGNATDRCSSHSIAAGDPSILVSPAPIPLFGEFLPVEIEPASSGRREPAVSGRQVVMEVSRELHHLKAIGGSELSFRLRLHQEHLGAIEVEIQRVNDVWSISITTAHEEARDVLVAEISRLENCFREHHLNLDAITVVTKAPENSIVAPTASEQSAGADFQQTGQPGFTEGQHTDQDVTRSNRAMVGSGVDIQA